MSNMSFLIDKNVAVPMRDGTVLYADVYRLKDAHPGPALLTRTPYDKSDTAVVNQYGINLLELVGDGYVVVIQDVRGRYASEGEFRPAINEMYDGYDSVEWIASQPWSNGKVGMFGVSYMGMTQWMAAGENPPHLCCIAPVFTGSTLYDGWGYRGGAFDLSLNMIWLYKVVGLDFLTKQVQKGEAPSSIINELMENEANFDELIKSRPLSKFVTLGDSIPWYKEWLSHPTNSEYWRSIAPKELYIKINVPVFNVGGWYDIYIGGTVENYVGMNQKSDAPDPVKNHLLVGPWSHAGLDAMFPEMDFGVSASFIGARVSDKLKRFYDYWLKDAQNGMDKEPPVEIFVMGDNRWMTSDTFPLPETNWTKYYIHSNGKANTLLGDGRMDTITPQSEPQDVYLFDPRNPVPTIGGKTMFMEPIKMKVGPKDQRLVEQRMDVLCYTSESLIEPLEVIGPVKATIYASSSAKDTDWTVKLVDVFPDGRAFNLADGILRGRFHNTFEKEELLEPGKIYSFEIDMWVTAHVFKPGHLIRIEISSSNFPLVDVNTNSGGKIADDNYSDLVQAVNKVYHTVEYPSHIVLPVIPKKQG